MKAKENFSFKKEWMPTDSMRGGYFPKYYVAGANDTGMFSDSPCRSDIAKAELDMVRKHLRKHGIGTRSMWCESSNVFLIRRFIIVKPSDMDRAKALVSELIKNIDTNLLYENN